MPLFFVPCLGHWSGIVVYGMNLFDVEKHVEENVSPLTRGCAIQRHRYFLITERKPKGVRILDTRFVDAM